MPQDQPEEATAETSTKWFSPTLESTRDVRRWLTEVLDSWALGTELVDDALLCGVELATNAVLHVRQPYGVFGRRIETGVHVAVIDERPSQLPVMVPAGGSASDILLSSSSGRGLQIVAALAARWGISTSQHAKSVWFELGADAREEPTAPAVVIGHSEEEPPDTVELRFDGLPVRTAVASGVQVEEAVRYVQLEGASLRETDRQRLLDLLDASASARLGGRHAALKASASDELWFDLVVRTTPAALAATAELSRFLVELAALLPRESAAVDDEVAAFRRWLNNEAARQLRGEAPQPFPRPT